MYLEGDCMRIILHIDVNNAFLSWTAVWMLKNGSKIDIRNKYAVIAGDEDARRGIVVAKSYPCKRAGVKTTDTLYMARKKCPYLEVYKSNFKIFNMYSNLMYNYLLNYTDKIERYSIDECFLDYTDVERLFGDPIKIAYKIKNDIKKLFGFTVNVGIGNNKLEAKMASDFLKPDRVHTLFDYEVKTKMWPLPIDDLFMVGKSTTKRLKQMGINTIRTYWRGSDANQFLKLLEDQRASIQGKIKKFDTIVSNALSADRQSFEKTQSANASRIQSNIKKI